jgi:ribonuclease HII
MAGVDEAGRGPLAGPVVAAAVILDPLRPIAGLRDSKQLSAPGGNGWLARSAQRRRPGQSGWSDVAEIDALNILRASLLAMRRALQALPLRPATSASTASLSAIRHAGLFCRLEAIVGGDARSGRSARSILAKVSRDQWMTRVAASYPITASSNTKAIRRPTT